jgi:4-diphosphocytidyl-2-C-methyl-D-erythritol kinase
MPEVLRGLAPAKVNLVLEVTGRRPDGYHEVDTVLQTLELADCVTVELGGEPGVQVSGPFAAGCPADESNLAWRAAEALAALAGRAIGGLRIGLDKQVPAAGGLGGGASDAATVLRLLQRAWPGVTDAMLLKAAEMVGSDEPAFVLGGTVRARGRGERVTPLPPLPAHDVVLFIPRDTIERKTARMFAALGALPFDDGAVAAAFGGRPPGPMRSDDVYNSFERVAFDLFEGLAALWEQLEGRVGAPVRLAGAGPTLFWIGPEGAGSAVADAAAGLPCTVIPTRTARSLWTD